MENQALYQQWMQDLLEIVSQVSQGIKEELGKVTAEKIEEKERHSLVSYVDKNAELLLVRKLGEMIPGCGFITEEDTVVNNQKEYTWIIDPLDGTTNFLHGIPHFSCSVGLQYQGNMILGAVSNIMQGEIFHAISGSGAYINKNKISLNLTSPLSAALVATGFPYSDNYNKAAFLQVINEILSRARGLRRLGSAALDLCFVAAGRLGVYYETSLNPWDVAAGALIVQEAGGVVVDFSGEDDYLYGKNIVASAPQHLDEILDIIRPIQPTTAES